MKNLLLLSSLLISGLFFSQQMQAQNGRFLEHVSLEAGWGLNVPVAPSNGISTSDFMGVQSFYVGANYELNELWGLRGTYAYNGFEHKNHSSQKLTLHKLMAEATLNLGNAFSSGYGFSAFNVIAHAGLGMSMGENKNYSGKDWMANFQIGVMPTYKISEKVRLLLDLVYVVNFDHDFPYGDVASGKFTGGYFLANVGVNINLGR